MSKGNRHALAVAYVALILASSGTAYAITVTGADVVNGSLTGADMKRASIPERDLKLNAVAVGDIRMSDVFSDEPVTITPLDGPTSVASVTSTAKNGFDSLHGGATFSITNDGTTPAKFQVRPYIDDKPHGADHLFVGIISPETTNLESVSFQCDGTPGPHEVELVIEVLEGAATVEQREWHVVPVPAG